MKTTDEGGDAGGQLDQELKAYFDELSQAVRCPESVRLGLGRRVARRGAGAPAILAAAGLLLALALAAAVPRLTTGLLARRDPGPVVLSEQRLTAADLRRVNVKFTTPSVLSGIGTPSEIYVLETPRPGAGPEAGQAYTYARFVYIVEGKPLVVTEQALEVAVSPSQIVVRVPGPVEKGFTNQVYVANRKTQFVIEGAQPVAVLLQVAQALAGP